VLRLWLLAILLVAATASAHPAPFSYIDLRLEETALEASLVVHRDDVAHDLGQAAERLLEPAFVSERAGAIRELVAPRIALSVDGVPLALDWSAAEVLPERDALRLAARSAWHDGRPGRLALETTLFPYDSAHQTFINVYENGQLETQAILDRDHPHLEYFTGSNPGLAAVAAKFVPAGVRHILIGADHVAFLIGLLLLGGSLRKLALLASAFTVAHSITLSLAALDVVSPPSHLIEPIIALSIVYVGVDNLSVRGGRDVRVWTALVFGLVHGFGFAGVLRAMELPSYRLGWSLFFFNLGVELGQLLILLVAGPALAALRQRSSRAAHQLAVAGSIGVIVAGTYWFVERLVFPQPAAQRAEWDAIELASQSPSDKK
jgi:hydrogenase/urease accessory protein HupE